MSETLLKFETLAQDCGNSIGNAQELPQSSPRPSISCTYLSPSFFFFFFFFSPALGELTLAELLAEWSTAESHVSSSKLATELLAPTELLVLSFWRKDFFNLSLRGVEWSTFFLPLDLFPFFLSAEPGIFDFWVISFKGVLGFSDILDFLLWPAEYPQ